ncbi:TVG0043618 [Thermoplasma volcanium GSS1]|uniref:TVG0043618 protein n=1 Tax=Thermoplasma volcanium (strain ATCC 51530 / DSM 4299 / JCM 9571 / NBRC 15438 / GSS1) TaxID=273116 RepID=Q97CR3_THEVO|nr:hemerythrin domain-containing protein [Thermoplasma volcanium]BAB59180.1 TVG0043618 [Thermoplasma volcanium GSS1]
MCDLAELLMVEHTSIRLLSNFLYGKDSLEIFEGFNDYLVKDHVEIEEKILFPVIVDVDYEDKDQFKATVERIKNDHRLIETLATNLIKWKRDGDDDKFMLRLPLFYKTLTDHNSSEEELIFPRWKNIDPELQKDALKEAISIIDTVNRDLYVRVTGISKDFIYYISGNTR